MNAHNLTHLEARLADILRKEISTWLRADGFDLYVEAGACHH